MLDSSRLPPADLPTLYAGLLGSAWMELAEPVRAVHGGGAAVRARGRLRIAHGRNHAARWLARLLRLPRVNEAADTRLVIAAGAGGETWHRTFDDRQLDTRQYPTRGGELGERFGPLEFRFRLSASQGSLIFQQTRVALVCGPIRLRIPSAWGPRIDAREDPAGARRIGVHVRVALPAVGPLVSYDGTIDIEDPAA